MRTLLFSIAALGLGLALLSDSSHAQDKGKKEVTLKGKITCAKCDLGTETECKTVIVVTDAKKKDITYYFDAAGDKKHHAAICSAGKDGQVTGVASKDGKKDVITVKSLKFN